MSVDKIKKDLELALKDRRSLEVSTLRLLLSVIQSKEKEKRFKQGQETPLTQEELIETVLSEAKKRKESIKSFELGQRNDLVEKEKEELEIIKKYLPQEISEQELEEIVKQAIKEAQAETIKDIGRVMALVMPQVKNRADGGQVSQKIKELLNQDGN
jgi:uncharacterized protein